jgi:hypothetical protein
VPEVKTRDDESCRAIDVVGGAVAPGFVGGKSTANVCERVDGNHAFTHVVCPFQDLGSYVYEERFQVPSAQDHDAGA